MIKILKPDIVYVFVNITIFVVLIYSISIELHLECKWLVY